MERSFKIKFDTKDAYLEGINEFMKTLDTWQNNEERKFDRTFDLVPETDEENNIYNLNVKVGVTEKE